MDVLAVVYMRFRRTNWKKKTDIASLRFLFVHGYPKNRARVNCMYEPNMDLSFSALKSGRILRKVNVAMQFTFTLSEDSSAGQYFAVINFGLSCPLLNFSPHMITC